MLVHLDHVDNMMRYEMILVLRSNQMKIFRCRIDSDKNLFQISDNDEISEVSKNGLD